MHIEDLLSRFEDVTEQPDGGFLAACPAHGDSHPSLRIWVGEDRKVRLTCRAGCKAERIKESARLDWADLFDIEGDVQTVASEPPKPVGPVHLRALADYVTDTSASCPDDEIAERAYTYMADRFGLSFGHAQRLGVGVDDGTVAPYWPALSASYKRFPRLTVPLYDFNGVARGLQGRDITGGCPGRWLSLTNPEGHAWARYGVFRGEGGYGATLFTEGPGDGLTAVAVGYDVVMIRGAALVSSPEFFAEVAPHVRGTQVIACGDADNAGQEFNRKLAEGFKAQGIDVYALPIPAGLGPKADLTDWRARDIAGFARELHDAVKAAQVVPKAEVEVVHAELAVPAPSDAVTVYKRAAAAYGKGDACNAYALAEAAQGTIRYAKGLGFMVWNGRVWEPSDVKVRNACHEFGAELVRAGLMEESGGFTTTRRINDMLTELRSVPGVVVAVTDFDNRPDLLSFANGTVELRSGKLREHRKEDMLTYALAIDYEPSAECPRWEQFLTEIFPENPDLVPYIQRLVGYGITGYTDEQCFCVLWGKGANGKSVFTDTLSTVFGTITKTTPFATFEEKPSGGIPNDIAALRGSRLVMASEGESGKAMSEAILKRASGKDMMAARFMRKEFFEFKPSFLIMLATNHKPKFKSQDDGLWRRVKMIPFKRFFAPHERDGSLDAKLAAEAQGIAAWVVRGAIRWFAEGLADPDSITSATKDYRETSDALAGFFPGVITKDESARMDGADAYNAYRDWCEAEGLPSKEIWTRRAFYSAMEERGVTKVRGAKGMALVGVRLTEGGAPAGGPGIFGRD